MKIRYHILLCLAITLVAFLFSGCDLNEDPKSEASASSIFSSESGLQTLSGSCY